MKKNLTFAQCLVYGIGGAAQSYMGNILNILAIPIFSVALGVDPVLIGLGMGLPRIWDAFFDPWIGHLSDSWSGRWGRRKPFMVTGSLVVGLSFGLLWVPSPDWSKNLIFAWFMVFSLVFYTGFALFSIPYTALAYEMAKETRERARLLAVKGLLTSIASLGTPWIYMMCFWNWTSLVREGSLLHRLGTLVARNPEKNAELHGIMIVGLALALFMMLGGLCTVFCSEDPEVKRPDSHQFFGSLKTAVKNRAFIFLNGGLLLAFTGVFLEMPLTYYINIYYLFDGDKMAAAAMLAKLGTVQSGLNIVAVPVCAWLVGRWGGSRMMPFFLGATAVGFSIKYWTYTPVYPWLQIIPMGIWAFAWCGTMLSYNVLLGDVCDYDEYCTGVRREGVYGAVNALINKVGIGVATGLSGVLLTVSGVKAADALQTAQAVHLLRLECATVPVFFLILALGVFHFYPLRDARAHEMREEIKLRRMAERLPKGAAGNAQEIPSS